MNKFLVILGFVFLWGCGKSSASISTSPKPVLDGSYTVATLKSQAPTEIWPMSLVTTTASETNTEERTISGTFTITFPDGSKTYTGNLTGWDNYPELDLILTVPPYDPFICSGEFDGKSIHCLLDGSGFVGAELDATKDATGKQPSGNP